MSGNLTRLADPPLVLASASPRRSEILKQLGLKHTVIPSHADESQVIDGDPRRLATRLASVKARSVREGSVDLASKWVLGADTVVAVAGQMLGKPQNRDDAKRMIHALAGRTHLVVTGLALFLPGAETPICRYENTDVTFGSISDPELRWYLDTDDWHDVAGAYRIQGASARFISSISGSYSNVVGLPIHLLYSILREHNYPDLG